LEITSWSFDVVACWVHGESLAIMPVFQLPVGALKLNVAPVFVFLGDIELGKTSLRTK
jgi:hypothetical protein